MYRIEHLPHTADICIHVKADTVEDLFRGALRGMNDILLPDACRKAAPNPVGAHLVTDSVDRTALLIDFLNDALVAIYEHRAVFCDVQFTRLTETESEAHLQGRPVEEFADDIKAVTYHDAEVRRNEEGKWETLVIFDI